MKYTYTDRNLIKEPEHYMYSPFEGKGFLDDYTASRTQYLFDIGQNYLKQLKDIMFFPTFQFSDIDKLDSIPTERILRLLLYTQINNEASGNETFFIWLNRFVAEFEVTKKIYTTYTIPEMWNMSNDASRIVNYILLSLTCILSYEETGNLKLFNCALKLNDLICSQYEEIKQEDTLLVIVALNKEIQMTKNMQKEKVGE